MNGLADEENKRIHRIEGIDQVPSKQFPDLVHFATFRRRDSEEPVQWRILEQPVKAVKR